MHVTNTNRLAFRVSVSVVNFAWVTLPLCLTMATIAMGLIMRYPCPHPCPHPHLHPHRWIELDCYLFSPRVTQIVIKRIENINFSRCRSTIARLIASPTSRRCIKLGAWGSDMFVGSTFTIRGSKRLEWQQSFVLLVLCSLSTYRFYYYKGFEVAYKHQRFIVKKYPSTPPESEGNNWNMMRWCYHRHKCASWWAIRPP